MKLSTRSRYGTRLMLDMAEHYRGGPIQLGVIAGRQGIPVKYLEQIMIPLKKAGYVSSVRGYKGGYMLAKPPEEVTVGEIVVLLERGLELTACSDLPKHCERAETCVMRLLWQQAAEAMYLKLKEFTFADLIKMVQPNSEDRSSDSIREEGQRVKIVSIAISKNKGTRKTAVEEVMLVKDHGIEGDAHAGPWHRQVSFLANESIEKARQGGLNVTFGDFAENFATEGIDWLKVPLGTQLRLGESVLVEITQIGKECHKNCAIYYQAGDCIMPREGIFARVLEGGTIHNGAPIAFIETQPVA